MNYIHGECEHRKGEKCKSPKLPRVKFQIITTFEAKFKLITNEKTALMDFIIHLAFKITVTNAPFIRIHPKTVF